MRRPDNDSHRFSSGSIKDLPLFDILNYEKEEIKHVFVVRSVMRHRDIFQLRQSSQDKFPIVFWVCSF